MKVVFFRGGSFIEEKISKSSRQFLNLGGRLGYCLILRLPPFSVEISPFKFKFPGEHVPNGQGKRDDKVIRLGKVCGRKRNRQ